MFDREVFSVKPSPSRRGLSYLLMASACALALIVAEGGNAIAQSTPVQSAPGTAAASATAGTPQASAPSPGGAINSFTGTDAQLSPQQLQALVGRIAIYPDDLLGLVLTASTQPLEIVEAQRFLEARKTDPAAKPPKTWDPSVSALLNYPDVVKLMDADLTWTEQLGTSVIDQRTAVLDAIQSFRGEAYNAGNLRSNDRETVTVSSDGTAQDQARDETISISPANPQVIYVPIYDPAAVVAPAPYYDWSAYGWSPAYPYYDDLSAFFFPGIFFFHDRDHRDHDRDGDHRDHDRDGDHPDHDHDYGHGGIGQAGDGGHDHGQGGVGQAGNGHLHFGPGPAIPPGVAIHGHSIPEPDHSAGRQKQAGVTGRDPAGIRPAAAAPGSGHQVPSTVAQPLPQVVRGGSAGISSPSSVQVIRGTPAIHNGAALPPGGFAGSSFAGPHVAGAHFGAPIGAPHAGMVASPIHGGMGMGGGVVHGGFAGGGGFHGGGGGAHR
jgi:hypothetical protein